MTAYPHHHGIHFGRPRLNLLLVMAVALAAIISVGAWLLADHYTGSSKGISDAQAISSIEAIAWSGQMPANERTYAIRMYRTAPYHVQGMKFFYAVGALSTHFQSKAARDARLSVGRANLIAGLVTSQGTNPAWITHYGVTVRQAATATVRGMFDGATK